MPDLTGGETLLYTSPTAVDLPDLDTRRWVARRKAAVVGAVRSGAIGLEEACGRYQLSEEEFLAWERGIAPHGIAGLRITRLQICRRDRAGVPEPRLSAWTRYMLTSSTLENTAMNKDE